MENSKACETGYAIYAFSGIIKRLKLNINNYISEQQFYKLQIQL